MILIHFHWLYS